MSLMPFTFYFLLLQTLILNTNSVTLPSVPCAPHLVPIETDPERQNYQPQVVALARCSGSVSNADLKCTSKTALDIDVQVFDFSEAKLISLAMSNHTSCEQVCRRDAQSCSKYETWQPHVCRCACPSAPPEPCSVKHIWDHGSCSCRCNVLSRDCPSNKQWSESLCACVCKETKETMCCTGTIDQNNCKCIFSQVIEKSVEEEEKIIDTNDSRKGVSFLVYGVSMGAEAVLLLLVFTLVYVYALRKPKNSKEKKYEPVKMMK